MLRKGMHYSHHGVAAETGGGGGGSVLYFSLYVFRCILTCVQCRNISP